MEEQTQLWKKSELQNRLRRPRDAAANSAPKQVNNAEQKTDGRSSANTQKLLNNATSEEPTETKFDSRLSADAQEFVPANYQTTSKKSSAQERLLKIKTDDEMQQDKSRVDQDVRRLDNVITTLTYDPGQFDDLLDLFVETFKPYIEDQEFIDIVAEMLFRKVGLLWTGGWRGYRGERVDEVGRFSIVVFKKTRKLCIFVIAILLKQL